MQTFLPYSNFQLSANCLDKRRCFCQLKEAKQILCQLRASNLPQSWQESKDYINQRYKNHPAVKMWISYEELLKYYYNIFLKYCLEKHHINTTMQKLYVKEDYNINLPFWLNKEQFHKSHRSRLIVKDREFYLPIFNNDENYNNGKYWWPDNQTKTFKII
jgi:hypothetical protein